jgi:DMSO/TMAO reductase YedYZ molybdopterin-dependent catalytic subunit
MGSSAPEPNQTPVPSTESASRRERGWRAAALQALPAAASASVTALAVSLFLGLVFGVPILAQEIGDRIVVLIPLRIFEWLLQTFGHQAKHLFFAGLVLVQGVVTTGLLLLYWVARTAVVARLRPTDPAGAAAGTEAGMTPVTVRRGPRAGLGDAAVLVALLWVAASVSFAPLLASAGTTPGFLAAWQLALVATGVPGVICAAGFVWLMRQESLTRGQRDSTEARVSRRAALRTAGIALAAIAAGAAAWQILSSVASQLGLNSGSGGGAALRLGTQPTRIVPPPTPNYGAWTPVPGQTAEVTPADQFYYVSKNLASDPTIASANWQLKVTGLVQRPLVLSYADLLAMPAVEQYQTLECISNEVGGNLMSDGRWTGAALAHLLDLAGIQDGATSVIFRCQDGYSDSLHLAQATGPHALVAYLLDGAPLAQPHGFPARLLVPGLYGMKNGKWLTELEVTNTSYEGYWEHQGWTPEAIVKTMSRIDVPADGDVLKAGSHAIAGVAYSGNRGISRVDVSTDAGVTWQTATLKRPLAEQTWVLWEIGWNVTPGTYVIAVRAIESDGTVQSPAEAPPLPDGASGFYAVTVTVQ